GLKKLNFSTPQKLLLLLSVSKAIVLWCTPGVKKLTGKKESKKLPEQKTAALVAAAVVTTWWQRRRRESGRMPTKWRRVGELAELRIYPLKSGASLTLKEAECTDIGVRTTGDEAVFYCNK
ncbi:Protein of unknown function, partial [Gryllus bimaculatus]